MTVATDAPVSSWSEKEYSAEGFEVIYGAEEVPSCDAEKFNEEKVKVVFEYIAKADGDITAEDSKKGKRKQRKIHLFPRSFSKGRDKSSERKQFQTESNVKRSISYEEWERQLDEGEDEDGSTKASGMTSDQKEKGNWTWAPLRLIKSEEINGAIRFFGKLRKVDVNGGGIDGNKEQDDGTVDTNTIGALSPNFPYLSSSQDGNATGMNIQFITSSFSELFLPGLKAVEDSMFGSGHVQPIPADQVRVISIGNKADEKEQNKTIDAHPQAMLQGQTIPIDKSQTTLPDPAPKPTVQDKTTKSSSSTSTQVTPTSGNQARLAIIGKKVDEKDQENKHSTFPVARAREQEDAFVSTAAPPKDVACGEEYHSSLVTPCPSDVERVDPHEGHIREAESIVVVRASSYDAEDLTSICVQGVDSKCVSGEFSGRDAPSPKAASVLNADRVIQASCSVDSHECLSKAVSRDGDDDVSVLVMSGAGDFAASRLIYAKDSELDVSEKVHNTDDASSKSSTWPEITFREPKTANGSEEIAQAVEQLLGVLSNSKDDDDASQDSGIRAELTPSTSKPWIPEFKEFQVFDSSFVRSMACAISKVVNLDKATNDAEETSEEVTKSNVFVVVDSVDVPIQEIAATSKDLEQAIEASPQHEDRKKSSNDGWISFATSLLQNLASDIYKEPWKWPVSDREDSDNTGTLVPGVWHVQVVCVGSLAFGAASILAIWAFAPRFRGDTSPHNARLWRIGGGSISSVRR